MTIVPMFLLTLGAINWGYVYPLVFLFTALLRQRVLGKEICFNFLYASSFWLLLAAGMSYALIGVRTISGVYHHGILPVIAFAIGWILAEGSSDEQIRDGILALAAGFGTYAALNMLVNFGNNRYRLIDFWTGTYRAATGSGALNTMPISAVPYAVKFEKRTAVKLLFLAQLLATIQYMFMLGTRTQFAILLLIVLLAALQFAYSGQGVAGVLKCIGIMAVIGLIALLFYQFNLLSILDYILHTNLAARYERRASLESSDSFRFQIFWIGLRELLQYPLGGRADQLYRHNMWLDVGRVAGILPFCLLLIYSIKNFVNAAAICKDRNVLPSLRCLLLFLYIGAYVNCSVEPIWEGALNFFLALCVVDGMISAMMRRSENESDPRESIPDASGFYANM